MSRSSDFPSPDVALALHQRLLNGDRLAVGEACDLFLPALLGYLTRRFPRDDPDNLHHAAHLALVDYLHHPHRYDPDKLADLSAYLRMAARSDLVNLQQREAKHKRGREYVELDSRAGNSEGETNEPGLRLFRAEDAEEAERIIEDITDDPQEKAVLRLCLTEERATAAFVDVLGLHDRPLDEQERLVKRAKDRIKKRIQRYKRHA